MSVSDSIIIDNGTGLCKAGFSNLPFPCVCFPMMLGTPRHPQAVLDFNDESRSTFIGKDAKSKHGALIMKYPVENGVVVDWEVMEQLWEHLFKYELKVKPHEYSVLLSEGPLNPMANREIMTKIMFETFNVPAMYAGNQAPLALYATGRTTGMVLASGDGVTHASPIVNGYCIPPAIVRNDIAGREVNEELARLLGAKGYDFDTHEELDTLGTMKEKLCFVALNFEKEFNESSGNDSFTLPDGNIIILGKERFLAPEIMFKPWLHGQHQFGSKGIHFMIKESISKCSPELHDTMYQNIALAGGNTTFKNFCLRLRNELKGLEPEREKIKILAPVHRQNSVYIGASILANLSSFKDMWIRREEYEEEGPMIVHRKCV